MSIFGSDDDPAVFAVQAFLDSLRPSRSHSNQRVDSLKIPWERGTEVETLDLLNACPIWHDEWLRHQAITPTPFARRFLSLRNRWSFRTVLIAAPRWKDEIMPLYLHTLWEFLSYWRCRSTVHWQVIGPPELLDELRGTNGGHPLPWNRDASLEQIAASHPMSLFLCQHEIGGD